MPQQFANGLRPDDLRGINLQELDKRVQGHDDLVNIYLGWLQEHLNDWDLSDSAIFRPQLESWYASLRFHGSDEQRVRDAFTVWMSSQIQNDPSCARRLLVAEEELFGVLSAYQTTKPRDLGMDHGTTGIITILEDQIIRVSSGDEDSDVEFLGCKRSDSTRSTSKPARRTLPPLTGANKENQRMQGTENRGPNEHSKEIKTRKKKASLVPIGTPPKKYVCDRCGEKGHFKENCPTNLDRSFDQKPTGGYQCYCCGAKEKHLTTLCPHNENPNSITQQRIRAGVELNDPSSPPRRPDHYRPPYNQSRKAKQRPSTSINSASNREGHRDTMYFDDDDDHRMDPARRALLERGRSSPRSDDRMEGLERSHYSPPREKRGRRSSMEDLEREYQIKRVRHWRERSRSGSRSIRSERGGSAELLPRVDHHEDGRLSYWDDSYDDVKMSSTVSLGRSRGPIATPRWPSDSLEGKIQHLFPEADAAWVHDMAAFHLDEFFHDLGDCLIPADTFQSQGDARVEMSIFDEEDEGQAMPTVRLPPAQENVPNKRKFVDEDQHRSPLDDTSCMNDIVEQYSYREGDNDNTFHNDNREIVVKLPKGSHTTLNMDNFSAQLKVNSPPPDDLNPELKNGKSARSPKDPFSNTDVDVGQEVEMLLYG